MRDADDLKWGLITFGIGVLTFSIPFFGFAITMTLIFG